MLIVRVLGLLVAGYALLAILVFAFQPRMLFLPDIGGRGAGIDPTAIGLQFEDVWIDTEDGERLHAWWIPHPGSRGSLLFSHGNAGSIAHRLESIEIFHELGLDVLIYDYRGYGRSSGTPSETGVYEDAEAARAWLRERADPDRIVLFGRSMGGAVSARLAADESPNCLILESTFTSVPDLAAELYWWLPVRRLVRIRMDTLSYLECAAAPVLVVHSRDDEIVPFEHALALQQAAGGDARLLELHGDHNTGFLRSGEMYVKGLDRFLAACLDEAGN